MPKNVPIPEPLLPNCFDKSNILFQLALDRHFSISDSNLEGLFFDAIFFANMKKSVNSLKHDKNKNKSFKRSELEQ